MKICLVGFQGAGKTTVGRWLASYVGVQFFDLDESLLAHHGLASIKEAYAKLGEARFRREESVCLEPMMKLPSYVIALGGGALEALDRIPEDVHVVYLFRPLEKLISEILPPYPLWVDGSDPDGSLRQRWEERHPRYFQRATCVVLVEKRSVEDDGHKVLRSLEGSDGE